MVSWAFARVGVHRPSLRLPCLGVFYSLFFTCHWISFVYFFTVVVSAPHHQPSSLFQTWDWHYGNWISEKVEIPWWWSYYSLLKIIKEMISIIAATTIFSRRL